MISTKRKNQLPGDKVGNASMQETIPGSWVVRSTERSPHCQVGGGKDRHHSGCETRTWSPTLVTVLLNTSDALPGKLSLDVAVCIQEGVGGV